MKLIFAPEGKEKSVDRVPPSLAWQLAGTNQRLPQQCRFGRVRCVHEINGDTRKTLDNTPPPLSPSQTLRLLWISSLVEVNGDTRGGIAVRSCSQLPSATAAYHNLKCAPATRLSLRPGIYRQAQRKTLKRGITSVQPRYLPWNCTRQASALKRKMAKQADRLWTVVRCFFFVLLNLWDI